MLLPTEQNPHRPTNRILIYALTLAVMAHLIFLLLPGFDSRTASHRPPLKLRLKSQELEPQLREEPQPKEEPQPREEPQPSKPIEEPQPELKPSQTAEPKTKTPEVLPQVLLPPKSLITKSLEAAREIAQESENQPRSFSVGDFPSKPRKGNPYRRAEVLPQVVLAAREIRVVDRRGYTTIKRIDHDGNISCVQEREAVGDHPTLFYPIPAETCAYIK